MFLLAVVRPIVKGPTINQIMPPDGPTEEDVKAAEALRTVEITKAVEEAKAVEIDRGANSIPTVEFNSTVGSIKALSAYTGITGFQATGKRWGVINTDTPFGTRKGVGQTMTGGSASSSKDEKARRAAKMAAKASEFKPMNNLGRPIFRSPGKVRGNSFGFAKQLEIVYGDSPKFGDMKARPTNNNFNTGKPATKGAIEGTNPSGTGFFGRLFGKPNTAPVDIKPSSFEGNKEFNKSLEYAKKGHSINPNDPRILDRYGTCLVKLDNVDEGLKHLHKALELDPIPQGAATSCSRYDALTIGYFCKEDFEKCISWGEKIQYLGASTWLMILFSISKNDDISKVKDHPIYQKYESDFKLSS